MKSLDEVIYIFEKACDLDQRCEDCSGCLAHDEGCPNDGAEAVPDALHYLKELKDLQYMHIPEGYCQPKIGDKNDSRY